MSPTHTRRYLFGPDDQTRSEFEAELLTITSEAWTRASHALVAGTPADLDRAGVYLRVLQVVEDAITEAQHDTNGV